MLTHREKSVIESTVWDATIGAGDDTHSTPTDECRANVKKALRRELTPEDEVFIEVCWQRCLQEMTQP